MNIQFDTASLSHTEAQAIITFLYALHGQNLPSAPKPAPTLATAANFHDFYDQLKASLATDPGPVVVESASGPVLVEPKAPGPATEAEPTKRVRRTKEQIAADEAAAAAAKQVAESAVAGAVPQATPAVEASATQQVNGVLKTISAEELRALLNGYIARHSMEEAIERLKSFGCNRVTEALALESAKLNELAAILNG